MARRKSIDPAVSAYMSKLARRRWKGVPPEERTALARNAANVMWDTVRAGMLGEPIKRRRKRHARPSIMLASITTGC